MLLQFLGYCMKLIIVQPCVVSLVKVLHCVQAHSEFVLKITSQFICLGLAFYLSKLQIHKSA